ncbi:hypothetical protein COO60DRAFT_427499 [Scenedesmus sp. NREL 46B-D3]|nr:hypothetical protein COO60DRAFT_427499 [Scenedesmus sp. NREL 46B-D3]
MARKAAEEALVRHYSYILAAEPDQELLLRSVFDNAVQRVGPKHLTADPFDPGTLCERMRWRKKRAEGQPKEADPAASNKQSKEADEEELAMAQGVLREAAWLAAGQHGFAALAGLPELQQIISHTCLPVLQRYACSLEEYTAADKGLQADAFAKQQGGDLNRDNGPLLAYLNPHLRVCLLAEVAAGLLVPGQPLPPDTAEHAAALYAFIDAAHDQVNIEVDCQPAFYGSSSSSNSWSRSRSSKQAPLQQALQKLSVVRPQSPAQSSKSDLAPHVDLQLQLPPHLLLELLLLQLQDDAAGKQQFQQRYGLQAQQMEGLSFLMAADESFAWMYQVAKQVQQQQHSCQQ